MACHERLSARTRGLSRRAVFMGTENGKGSFREGMTGKLEVSPGRAPGSARYEGAASLPTLRDQGWRRAEVLPLSARWDADRVSTASPRSEDSLSKVWLARPVMLRCLSLIRRLLCF